jgi:hypothetical protein
VFDARGVDATSTTKLYAARLPSSIYRESYRTIGMLAGHYRREQAYTKSLAGSMVRHMPRSFCLPLEGVPEEFRFSIP